jgi:hypothetical protein
MWPRTSDAHSALFVFFFRLLHQGGLYTAMGSEFFVSDLVPNRDALAAKLAWQMQSGITMGWMSLGGTQTAPPMGLYDLLVSRLPAPNGALVYADVFQWIQTLDAYRTQAVPYLVQGRRSRELHFEYTATSSSSSSASKSYAHPHRNELHTAKAYPSAIHAQTTLHDDDAKKEVEASSNQWMYSAVTASVWSAADGSSLALLLLCSSSATAGSPSSYTVTIPAFNVASYGVTTPQGAEKQPWVVRQFSSSGLVVGTYAFPTGEQIKLKLFLTCRDVMYFTLTPMPHSKAREEAPKIALE